MGFTFREDKGSDLTPTEVDENFREVDRIKIFATQEANRAEQAANAAAGSEGSVNADKLAAQAAAQAAATSEGNAATSANTASTAAGNAATSENNAGSSATAASNAATVATDKAADAERSAIDAEQSSTAAGQHAADAQTAAESISASVEPEPNKVPRADDSGTIKQAWVKDLEFELDALRAARLREQYGDGPYPVLDLGFVGANRLDPRVNFSRATPTWDYDEHGNFRKYEIDEPVFAYDPVTGEAKGLQVYPARTNLLTGSANPANQSVTVTAVAHTISFYGTGSVNLTGAHVATVDASGFRTRLTFTPTVGQLSIVYVGDVSKPQLELGTTPTPYIPTEGSQVTVAATNLGPIPIDMTRDLTVFTSFVAEALPANERYLTIGLGYLDAIYFVNTASSNQLRVYSTGKPNLSASLPRLVVGQVSKMAITYQTNGRVVAAINGEIVFDEITDFELPEGSEPYLAVKSSSVSTSPVGYGPVRSIKQYARALTDIELQELTK